MFHKLNVKTLIIILVILAAILVIINMAGDNERSFKSNIVEVDTSQVTSIHIFVPKNQVQITLTRTGNNGNWTVSSEGHKYNADPNVIKNILAQLNDLKAERIAARNKDKWDKFEVSDSTGIRVILKGGKKQLADLYIGKFSYAQPPQSGMQNPYQQQRGKMTSFVRLEGENEVYAVDGFLKMSYQADVNSYRNKLLVNVDKNDISRLVFNYPENEQFTVSKNENQWLIDGEGADSASMVKYLNKIHRLTSSNFVDPSTVKTSDATYSLRIEGNNFAPVELKAYPSDSTTKFVITSSLNQGAEFNGSKSKLFEKIFINRTELMPGDKK